MCIPISTLMFRCSRARKVSHKQAARLGSDASSPRLKPIAAGCGKGVLARRRGVGLARVRVQAGEAITRGGRAGPVSFRGGSARCVLGLS